MPVLPGATESLSGGAGVTRVALVTRIMRDRFDDNPNTYRAISALDGAGVTDELTVLPDANELFDIGGTIDFVADGTFESCLIEGIINSTTLKLRRAHRGSTIAAHAADAVFRYEGRVDPLAVSNGIDEAIDNLWPDVFDVRHVAWTVPDPTDFWWVLPDDAEGVHELYQRTTGTTTDLAPIDNWGGPWFLDSGFLGGADTKAVQARNVATNAPDDKLHAVYQAKVALTTLTAFQITLLTYEVAASVMASQYASESKPERRSGQEGAPDARGSFQFFAVQAESARKREAKRLAEFLPRKHRRQYRGMRHFSEVTIPLHPVRD